MVEAETQAQKTKKSLLERFVQSPKAGLVPAVVMTLTGTAYFLDKVFNDGGVGDSIAMGINYIGAGCWYLAYGLKECNTENGKQI